MKNYKRMISLNKASMVTGVNIVTMRKDIEKGRLDAIFYRGRYRIEISCTVFGKGAEFAEQYLHKGTKIAVIGRIQTGSYEKDGKRIYTTDVIVEEQEFAESKNSAESAPEGFDDFMKVADGEGLPFV